MRSFLKRRIFISLSLAVVAALLVGALAQKKDDDKAPAKDKPAAVKKPDAESAAADPKAKDPKTAKAPKTAKPKEKKKIEIPLSKDHPGKGLRIPIFDDDGKKQFNFTIGVGTYIDEEHVGLAETQIESIDDDGKPDLTIDLPKSELNTVTRILSTQKHVEIKRDDFTITGETMEYNLNTKMGTLGGGVKMVIFNLENEFSAAPEPKAN
jgi:LPS export ABC transporter protein LptC